MELFKSNVPLIFIVAP